VVILATEMATGLGAILAISMRCARRCGSVFSSMALRWVERGGRGAFAACFLAVGVRFLVGLVLPFLADDVCLSRALATRRIYHEENG
jgi:hypothetical protein